MILVIHTIVLFLLFAGSFFAPIGVKKIIWIGMASFGFSLVMQGSIYILKPGWYGNKTRTHPHQQ